ncbi:DUF636 domain protein [Colletotrichum truncatum]|uniref:DUF636 domain protein n=1 Tax=Colletotrichum truncatum TaxID=5467 RepID=A0ACC3YU78_COLTU|nr:duf636 domain protein [Colletotrichum truncatum]KAF6798673.1 duf636 domain protein [Colletotrichum truncatum]
MASSQESTTTTGECSCGKIKYSFQGKPLMSALCHCLKCKRSNGSSFSTNLIVPEATFKFKEGEPAQFVSKGDTGKDGTSHFCRNCGSPLIVSSAAVPGVVIVKAGTLDDWESMQTMFTPTTEMFCATKFSWLPAVEGAASLSGSS